MAKALILLAVLFAVIYGIFNSPKKEPVDEEHMLSGHQRQMDKAQNLENVLDDSAMQRLEKADSVE